MQQTKPQEAAVGRVKADRPEPAQLPHRPGAAHHPRMLLGRERKVRAPNARERESSYIVISTAQTGKLVVLLNKTHLSELKQQFNNLLLK